MSHDKENKKCNECENTFEDYSVLEKGKMKGSKVENPDICQDCMSKGWQEPSVSDFQKDSDFNGKISVQSPLTPPSEVSTEESIISDNEKK